MSEQLTRRDLAEELDRSAKQMTEVFRAHLEGVRSELSEVKERVTTQNGRVGKLEIFSGRLEERLSGLQKDVSERSRRRVLSESQEPAMTLSVPLAAVRGVLGSRILPWLIAAGMSGLAGELWRSLQR